MSPRQVASGIGRRLGRLRALAREERWALLHGWVLLAGLQIALAILPLRRIMRLLRSGNRRAPRAGLHPERLASLVEVAARYQRPAPTCLAKSLAVYALLLRRGLDAGLVIAARRNDGRLDAHAWPEHMGRPLPEGAARPGYEPLIRWRREQTR